MALSEATKEAIYLQFSRETWYALATVQKMKLFSNNCGVIKLTDNPIHHNQSKHINVRHHIVRRVLQSDRIEIVYKSMEDADVLTKGLTKYKHQICIELLGSKCDDVEVDYSPSLEGKC